MQDNNANSSSRRKSPVVIIENEQSPLNPNVQQLAMLLQIWLSLVEYMAAGYFFLYMTQNWMTYTTFASEKAVEECPSLITSFMNPLDQSKFIPAVQDTISCFWARDGQQITEGLIAGSIRALPVLLYMFIRHFGTLKTTSSADQKDLPPFLGLFNILRTINPLFIAVVLFHFADLFTNIRLHSFFEMELPFSIENLIGKTTGKVDYANFFTMVIFTPLQEEIMFRGIFLYIITSRFDNRLYCVVFSNVLFGLFHLVNFSATNFTAIYISLQVFLGILIGTFYSLRFLKSKTIWEPIFFHMVNNLLSVFVSGAKFSNVSDPTFIFSVCESIVFYGFLCIFTKRQLDKEKFQWVKEKRD